MKSMNLPSEHRIKQIKEDLRRIKEMNADPVKIACELADFFVKIHLEQIRKKQPDITKEEAIDIIRKRLVKRELQWKTLSKHL
ncbi:MAG: hypothetical protein KAI34_00505 [Candidatus Lokiarchaeota archaeon]|nr:hypothetical protein [Candidatus Lokiarchaeota archaeon]